MAKVKSWTIFFAASILLVEVEAELTPPPPESGVRLYLSSENMSLKNYSFINASLFFDHDVNDDEVVDGLWCQSASSFNQSLSAGGGWYTPNGESVTFDNTSSPLYQAMLENQFVLLRDGSINSPDKQGLYQCKIPHSYANVSVLVIDINAAVPYNSNDGPNVTGNIQFSMVSANDVVPAVFSLSFNVTNGPPSDINCSVNNAAINLSEEQIVREVLDPFRPISTRVTIIFQTGEEGEYNCTVSNRRVDDGEIDGVTALADSFQQKIKVAACPTNITQERLSVHEYLITWKLPSSAESSAMGYQIFYVSSVGIKQSTNATSGDNVTLTGLVLGETYHFTVVSFGPEFVLPSVHCQNITIVVDLLPPVEFLHTFVVSVNSLTVAWGISISSIPPESYSFSYSCHVVSICYVHDEYTTPYYTESTIHLTATNYTITNLIPETQCEVSVRTVYKNGEISPPVDALVYVNKELYFDMSDNKNVTPCALGPNIIEGLEIEVINNSAIVLVWIPVVPQCCISYYKIFYHSDNEATMEVLTTYPLQIVTGLTSGKEYYFHVSPVLTNGSEGSNFFTSTMISSTAWNDVPCCNTVLSCTYPNMSPQPTMSSTSSSLFFSISDYVIGGLVLLLLVSAITNVIVISIHCAKRRSRHSQKSKLTKGIVAESVTTLTTDVQLSTLTTEEDTQYMSTNATPAPQFQQNSLLDDHVYSSILPRRKEVMQENEDYEDMSLTYRYIR